MKEYEKLIQKLKKNTQHEFDVRFLKKFPDKLVSILKATNSLYEQREKYCEAQPTHTLNFLHLPAHTHRNMVCTIPKYMIPFIVRLSNYFGCVVVYRSASNVAAVNIENRSVSIIGQEKECNLCIEIIRYFIGYMIYFTDQLVIHYKKKNKILFGNQVKANKKANDHLENIINRMSYRVRNLEGHDKYSYRYYAINVSMKKTKALYRIKGIINSRRGFSNNRIVILK